VTELPETVMPKRILICSELSPAELREHLDTLADR